MAPTTCSAYGVPMTTFRRFTLAALCSACCFTFACQSGVRVTHYCPEHRTFVVTTRDDGAQVTIGSDSYHLLPVATDSGARYSDGVRNLSTLGPEAALTVSDSLSFTGCTSAPHP
jgi:membrane-bound inhibitor of C-type lysozyme